MAIAMFTATRTDATTAATVTAGGRSPSRSGTSCARASTFCRSERDGGLGAAVACTSPAVAARARFRALRDMRLLQRRPQRRGRGARIARVADRAHDHRASRACARDLADVRLVDAADREERLGG